MGTDIIYYAEKRVDGVWEPAFGAEYDHEELPRPEWRVVSNEEMAERCRSGPVPDDVWTRIEYTQSYAYPGYGVLVDTIPKLSAVGPPEDVRVVFCFCC